MIQGMILACAGIVTRLIGIAYRIPLNNILGDEGQGFYGCAFSIYNIALLLTSYSLPLAVSKLVSARIAKKQYRNALRIFKGALLYAVLSGVLAAVIVFVFSDYISNTLMGLKLSTYALKVLAPGLLIVAIMGVVRGFFQGMGTMVPTAASQIVEQIINAVISIVGASYLIQMCKETANLEQNPSLPLAYGAAGGTLGTVAGATFGFLFLLFVLKIYYPRFRAKTKKDSGKSEESYGEIYKILFLTISPVILNTAIYNISDTLDQGIFSNIMVSQGHTEQEISELLGMLTGKYNTLINIPLAIANALGAALIPSLIATMQTGGKQKTHGKINLVIRVTMILAIPSCVAFMTMPEQILLLLYRTGNIAIPANMLRIGGITVIFYCLSTVTNSILQGVNKMSAPVKHGAIALVIHFIVVFFTLIVCKGSIYSIVIGKIVFSFVICVLNTIAMRKATRYKQEYKQTFLLPLVSASIMGAVIFILNQILGTFLPGTVSTLLVISIAAIVYIKALFMTKALTKDEILLFPKGSLLLKCLQKIRLI